MPIVRNSAKCLSCLDEIESTHRHDFVFCACGELFVDGGRYYLRIGGVALDKGTWEDTSIVEEYDE